MAAKHARLNEWERSAASNLDAALPRWAKELAGELERENEAHRTAVIQARGWGYVRPVREPWTETAAVLQQERDRLTCHLVEVASARAKQEDHRHHAATAERVKAGVGWSDPVPAGRLGAMLAVERSARRRYPAPPAQDMLPLAPGDQRKLATVRPRVTQLLHRAIRPR